MEHQKKDDEDPFVLRTVCYAGQLQFIEVLKSNESGSVTYQDFLESCKGAFKIAGDIEDMKLQNHKFVTITEKIFNKRFNDTDENYVFNVVYLPKDLIAAAAAYSTNKLLANTTEETLIEWALGSNLSNDCPETASHSNVNQLLPNKRVPMEVEDNNDSKNPISYPLDLNDSIVPEKKLKIEIEPWLLRSSEEDYATVMREHKQGALSDRTVHLVVRLVVDGLQTVYGKNPHKESLIAAAKAITEYFPYLEKSLGQAYFYNPLGNKNRKGALVNRIKRINQNDKKEVVVDKWSRFPVLSNEDIKDKMMIFNGLDKIINKKEIENIMYETFRYRRSLDNKIFVNFQRFLDIPYLIEIDYALMYPNIKNCSFDPTGIKNIVDNLLTKAAIKNLKNVEGWDEDTMSLIKLVYLLPSKERRSWAQFHEVIAHLIIFNQAGKPKKYETVPSSLPILMATGTSKTEICQYWISMDAKFIPIAARNIIEAMDTLFKCIWVFDTVYDSYLKTFFEFVESYFYKISSPNKFSSRQIEISFKIDEKKEELKRLEKEIQNDQAEFMDSHPLEEDTESVHKEQAEFMESEPSP